MGIAERRARQKEALRQTILETATDMLIQEGYAAFSLRKLAQRIEYAPSTLYLYFPDKFAIVAAICMEVFEKLSAELTAVEVAGMDPIAGLRRGLRAYIELGLAHPKQYMITFGSEWPEEYKANAAGRDLVESSVEAFSFLVRGVQRAQEAGQLAPGDPLVISQTGWAACHGLTSILIIMAGDVHFPMAPANSLIDNMIEMFIRGHQAK